jgi:hypothetical protein
LNRDALKSVIPSDFYYQRFVNSILSSSDCSSEEMQSMVDFGVTYGFGSSIKNSFQEIHSLRKLPDCWFPLIQQIAGKRKNKEGKWECQVIWKDYWLPLDQCSIVNNAIFQVLPG